MATSKNKIDDYLLSTKVLIEGSLSDSIIKTTLAGHGFPETKLNELKASLDQVMALHLAQKKEFGDQVAATAEVNGIWEIADKRYMKALKFARVVLKDDTQAAKAMMLYGSRKESLPSWLVQAKAFYTNLLGSSELTAKMTEFGYPPEKLQDEAKLVDELEAKLIIQKKEMGESQAATELRDQALDKLAAAASDLRAIVKALFSDDNPQMLEKIGILARREGAAPKKPQDPDGGVTD